MRVLCAVTLSAALLTVLGTAPAAAEQTSVAGSPEGAVTAVRGLAAAPAVASLNTPISRAEVLARAKVWGDDPVPYSMYKYFQGYRTDCSGFVSMAWRMAVSATTGTFGPYTHAITKSELKGGDALDWNNTGPGVGHIVLFEKWANSAHTSYWAFEQTPGQTKHRVVPYPYFAGHGGPYKPIRYDKITDGGVTVQNSHDVNGDLLADVLARDTHGDLYYYKGKGNGTFRARVRSSKVDFSRYGQLLGADVNGDGRADVLARDPHGTLFFYQGQGNGTYAAQVRHSTIDFSPYSQLQAADVNGDGRADVLGRDSHGRLYYFRGLGNGTYAARVRSSSADFTRYNRLLSADVNGDGHADLLARDTHGVLYYYRGTGKGRFAARVHPSTASWGRYDKLLAADVNGDGRADVVARTSSGALYYYRGTGKGAFAGRVRTYTKGWGGYNALI